MKKILLLLSIVSITIAHSQQKSTEKLKTVVWNPPKSNPNKESLNLYEVGDNICNSFCYNFYKNDGWGGEEYGNILVKTVASVEKVANSKIQIKIISIKRERYGQNCQEIRTDTHIYHLKYGDTELLENQTYWIDPTKNITWIKCN